jgi:hypothetical protein
MMITVNPGITPERMRVIWRQAMQEAQLHPGETVVISFAPGTYPMPELGAYVYDENPHNMIVHAPGIEMHFRARRAGDRVAISAAQIAA